MRLGIDRSVRPAGLDHAMIEVLTLFDRARWSGKQEAAAGYRRCLLQRLEAGRSRRTRKPELSSSA